jgi:hypothetical protein
VIPHRTPASLLSRLRLDHRTSNMGILTGFTITAIGTFSVEHSSIKKWVEANGGRYSKEGQRGITHLIASKEAWNKGLNTVIKASESGAWVVSYDWLEDSLQRKRKLAEKKYTWEILKREKKRSRQLKKLGAVADGKKFREGCEQITELTGSGTSKKLPKERAPKRSKSFFFAEAINTPFVSATDALKQRRAEREAAEAAEKAAKAAKKAAKSSSGTEQTPMVIDDHAPSSAQSSSVPAAAAKTVSEQSKLPTPPASAAASPTKNEPQAKKSLKDLYHFYLDSTGFEYKIVVVRSNFAINSIARYQLSILESNAKPHRYCTLAVYTPPAGSIPDTATFAPGVNLRNPLLNFLRTADDSANEASPSTPNNPDAPRLRSPTQQQVPDSLSDHPEAARLTALITPPTPCATDPYKALICPMNSSFLDAWRAFRHAFRDLTLLTWEERFEPARTIQKARALALSIEPFAYAKPTPGMPVGTYPQQTGLYQARADGTFDIVMGAAADGYTRNAYGLPATDEPLGKTGFVGAAIQRDIDERERKEEAVRKKIEESERKKKGVVKEAKRVNYNKPLFVGPLGRPVRDAEGNQIASAWGGRGGVKRSRPFWGNRE